MTTTHPSGFAPAASPLAPTMIHTPDGAISAGITSIPSQGDDMPAYYARPKASDGALPVVIVVQEILAYMNTFAIFADDWRWKAISLSRRSSISAKATPMISPIYPHY